MERRCQGPGILESDCANVIAALKTKEGTRSSLWSVLAEAKAIMRRRPDFELSRINRVSNVVAHTLAQLGKCESGFWMRLDHPVWRVYLSKIVRIIVLVNQ
jgi:hypothetical protein